MVPSWSFGRATTSFASVDRDRREVGELVTVDDLVALYGLPAGDIAQWQQARILVMQHASDGTLVGVTLPVLPEPRPPLQLRCTGMTNPFEMPGLGGRVRLLILLAAVSGCASSHRHDSDDPKLGPAYLLYSPTGEALNGGPLGRPKCEEAMAQWFDRVDANHDGAIGRDEFMADASLQFRRMDIDQNGYLLPEELERYRLPYRQDTTPERRHAPPSYDTGDGSGPERPHRRGHREASEDESHRDRTGESTQGGLPDPVMSADLNNDFRVTPQEFMARMERTFVELDADRNGAVSRDELLKSCVLKGKRP